MSSLLRGTENGAELVLVVLGRETRLTQGCPGAGVNRQGKTAFSAYTDPTRVRS